MQMNGFDLDGYSATVTALQQQPQAAKITFRGRFDWDGAFAGSASSVEVEQAGERTARPFVFRCDVPGQMLGGDNGSMPAERMLSALAHCIGTSFAVQATKSGIVLEGLQVELSGEIDLCGFLDLDAVRPGFSGISVRLLVDSPASDQEIDELARAAARFSPMFDSLSQPVTIGVRAERV